MEMKGVKINKLNAKIAKEYFNSHKIPNKEKMPRIITYWHRTIEGKDFIQTFDVTNGEESLLEPNHFHKRVYSRDNDLSEMDKNLKYNAKNFYLYIPYINHEPDLNMYEFAILKIMCDGRKKTVHDFEYSQGPIYIFENDLTPYDNNGELAFIEGGLKYNKGFYNWLTKEWMRSICCCKAEEDILEKEILYQIPRPNTPYANIWSQFYMLPKWYANQGNFEKKKSKNEQEVEKIEANLNLIDIKENNWKFEKISDNWCVIRGAISYYGSRFYDTTKENSRIFINSKGEVIIKQIICGDWERIQNFSSWGTSYPKIENIEDIKSFERTNWLYSILKESDKPIRIITQLLRHPIIEKIYKAGYPKLAKNICKNNEIKKNLEYEFGAKETSRGSITKILGLNKYQLNYIESKIDTPNYSIGIIKKIKQYLEKDSISDMSNETFVKYIKFFNEMHSYYGNLYLEMANLSYETVEHNGWYVNREKDLNREKEMCFGSIEKYNEFKPNFEKIITRYNKFLEQGVNNYYRTLKDIIFTYRNLGENAPNIEGIYDIKNIQELINIHDALVNLYDELHPRRYYYYRNDEVDNKKSEDSFKKLQDDRIEKYEYENEIYSIKMPKSLAEIVDEGSKLRHCVGGYTRRHAIGETNIIFLRKKDDINTPFFTIEVKGNRLIQIHGYCNRALGTEPDVINFVCDWLRKIGAKAYKEDLLTTTRGYGDNGIYLNEKEYNLKGAII